MPLVGALGAFMAIAVACTSASVASPSEPTQSDLQGSQPTVTVESPQTTPANFLGAPIPDSQPEPVSDAELQRLLRGTRFSTSAWSKTNFNIHSISFGEILSGGPGKGGIPAIFNPKLETVASADEWLSDGEPVQVVQINGEVRAYPKQILIWHEIVNDTVGGEPIAVTFCPLCNTSFVFSRRVGDLVLEFNTTGLLRFSNLVMWDLQTETWWQEATGTGIVGDLTGVELQGLPMNIVSWEEFKTSFPDAQVLSVDTGHNRPYGSNPYAGYDTSGNPFLFDGELDRRLFPVERVVGINIGDESIAIPYTDLAAKSVTNFTLGGQELVVFHKAGVRSTLDAERLANGRDVGAVGVFDPNLDGRKFTFAIEDGRIVDNETGSVWSILGRATSGSLQGKQLTAVVHHPGQFWFSWVAFKPNTRLYSDGSMS